MNFRPDEEDDFEVPPEASNGPEDFAQMLQDSFARADAKLSVGQKIRAEVLSVGKEYVIVSTGRREDGFVPAAELLDAEGKPRVKRGERIDLYVASMRGSQVFLSPNSGRRVSVGDARGDAHAAAKSQLVEGQVVKGPIKRLEKFGAFVEIAPGIEALAHVSELSWARVKDPSDLYKVGDLVSGTILRIEGDGGRLKVAITLKAAAHNPWANLPSHIAVGNVVSGRVTRCMSFGAFVELQPGMEGLIPLSEMSATKRVTRADEFAKEGSTVSVLVKHIDPDAKRISLSLKGAANQAEALDESENIREYKAKQASREKAASGGMGALGAKLQAALEKKK